MHFPEQELCDFFFRVRIYANLQQFAAHGWDMKPVAESEVIQHIVKKTTPKKPYLKLTRYLFEKRMFRLLSCFLKIGMVVKRIIKK